MSTLTLEKLAPLVDRRFQSFAEATDAALDSLAASLPGCIVLTQTELEGGVCRVFDFRGPNFVGTERAMVMPTDGERVEPEAAEHESNEIEYEIKEVVEVKRVNKENVAAEPIEALPPFGERGAQAFTIPDSVDDFDLPDPVVTEPTGSQGSKVPEPLSAYEAAFGAAAEEAVEPEPRAFGPAPGSFEAESEGELGKARVTNDELRTQLEDSRSRIEELESTDERLRITEQEVERLEEECRSSKAALLAAQAKLSAALADAPTAE